MHEHYGTMHEHYGTMHEHYGTMHEHKLFELTVKLTQTIKEDDYYNNQSKEHK